MRRPLPASIANSAYGQYAQAVAALARKFGEFAIAGERIAYLMRNSLAMAVAL